MPLPPTIPARGVLRARDGVGGPAAIEYRGAGATWWSSSVCPRRRAGNDARRRRDTRLLSTRRGSTVRDVRLVIAPLLVPGLVLLTSSTLVWLLLRS